MLAASVEGNNDRPQSTVPRAPSNAIRAQRAVSVNLRTDATPTIDIKRGDGCGGATFDVTEAAARVVDTARDVLANMGQVERMTTAIVPLVNCSCVVYRGRMESYRQQVACAVSGLTYRQLDHMIRSGFFTPDLPAHGSGVHRGFSYRDLLALRCIGSLRSADVSLQATRKVDRALRAYGRDFADSHLVVTGKGNKREVYVYDRKALIALLDKPGQVGIATIVDVGQAEVEVREIVARESKAQERRKAKAA